MEELFKYYVVEKIKSMNYIFAYNVLLKTNDYDEALSMFNSIKDDNENLRGKCGGDYYIILELNERNLKPKKFKTIEFYKIQL